MPPHFSHSVIKFTRKAQDLGPRHPLAVDQLDLAGCGKRFKLVVSSGACVTEERDAGALFVQQRSLGAHRKHLSIEAQLKKTVK